MPCRKPASLKRAKVRLQAQAAKGSFIFRSCFMLKEITLSNHNIGVKIKYV